MYDVQVLMDKIQSFSNSREIAELIKSYNIVGCRQKARRCALAQMFKQTTNAMYVSFSLVNATISVLSDLEATDKFILEDINKFDHYDNSGPMMEFIVQFDQGDYPELECDHEYHSPNDI